MSFNKGGGIGGGAADDSQTIVEAIANYQVLAGDDIINCDGTFNVTLVASASAIKEITINSTNGAITVLGDATIEGPTVLTTGMTITLYFADGEWRQK